MAAPKKRAPRKAAPAKETVADPTPPAPEPEAVAEPDPTYGTDEGDRIVVHNGTAPPKRPKCVNCDRTSVVTTNFAYAENVDYCNVCLPVHLRYLLA